MTDVEISAPVRSGWAAQVFAPSAQVYSLIFTQVTRQKAPKIARFSRLRTRPQCCAQFVNRRLRLLLIDAHPRRFADPQDDSIFHPRTWHRAARFGQVSFHFSSQGFEVECRKAGPRYM